MKRHIPTFIHACYGMCFGIFIYSRWLNYCISNSSQNPRACLDSNHWESQTFHPSGNERQLLFVGIMTSRKTINSRALAIHRTWAKHIPGKVVFFIGKGQDYVGDLPVISLDNVSDDVYPPQPKSFAMLEYMYRQYGQIYEWFLRADDDIFINISNLETFLKSVNSSKPEYIGQPGLGKPHEIGNLGLSPSSPFCMGGPGVILSWKSLERLGPGLSDCLKKTVTSHEDTELGRCVHSTVGIHCTASYEFRHLLYQIRNESVIRTLQPALRSALTIHPFKNSSQVYKLQVNLQELMIRQLRLKLENTEKEVSRLSSQLDKERIAHETSRYDSALLGSLDHSEWSFIQSGRYYSKKHPHQELWSGLHFMGRKYDLDIAVSGVYKHLRLDRASCYVDPHYGYQRLTPTDGLKHVLIYRCRNSTRMPFLTQQKFQSFFIIEQPTLLSVIPKNNIYIVLLIENQSALCLRFLRQLTSISRQFYGGIYVYVIVQRDAHNDHVKALKYASKFSKNNLRQLNVSVIESALTHRRAIKTCVETIPTHGLILWTDPRVVFTVQFFNRLLLNTVEHKQAYFPITFSTFNKNTVCYKRKTCNIHPFNLEEDQGMWRHFGFGIVGIYKSDFIRVVTFNTSSKDLLHEGTELYDDLMQSYLHLFRAVDPGITFLNQPNECNSSLTKTQSEVCHKLTYSFLGSQRKLAEMYLGVNKDQ